jgi:hypothetical protein
MLEMPIKRQRNTPFTNKDNNQGNKISNALNTLDGKMSKGSSE